MSYCTKCGKRVGENEKFCTQCGNMLKNEHHQSEIPQIKSNTYSSIKGQAKLKANLSKKLKIFIGIFLFVIIIFASLHMVGKSFFGKEVVVKSFIDSLMSADVAQVSKRLTANNPKLQITDASVKHLIKNINENPTLMHNIINSLEIQSKKFDKTNSVTPLNNWPDQDFVLARKGKKFLIFDNYVIEARAFYIKLYIGLKDTIVSIEEGSTIRAESNNYEKEIGPFIPGIYEINAECSGQYAKFNKKLQVQLISNNRYNVNKTSDKIIEQPIKFDEAKFLKVDSNYNDAEVYIDGKSTGVLIKDAKIFGPVNTLSKIYAIGKSDGITIKSNEVQIGASDDVYLTFIQDEAKNLVSNGKSTINPPAFNIITASSELKEAGYNHEPKNIIDSNLATAWVEGSTDDGIGQWIKLGSNSVQDVSGIKVINGYTKGNDAYYKNNRVAKILIEFSDSSSLSYDLNDQNMEFQNIDFRKSITTKYIKLTILKVYKGTTYNDTCISEVSVY